MKSFEKKDSLLKIRETALKKNLKKRKKFKTLKKGKMSVLSDKWIKKAAKTKGMIKPFVGKQVRKGKISFGYLHMAMMHVFLMNLKYLLM